MLKLKLKFMKKHQFALGLALSLSLLTACGSASFTGKTGKKGKSDSPTQLLPTDPGKPGTDVPKTGDEKPTIDPSKPVDPGVDPVPPVTCPVDPNPNQSGSDDPGQSENPGQSSSGNYNGSRRGKTTPKPTTPTTPVVCHDAKGGVVTCPVDCNDPTKNPVQN